MLCHPELHPGLTYALRNAKSRFDFGGIVRVLLGHGGHCDGFPSCVGSPTHKPSDTLTFREKPGLRSIGTSFATSRIPLPDTHIYLHPERKNTVITGKKATTTIASLFISTVLLTACTISDETEIQPSTSSAEISEEKSDLGERPANGLDLIELQDEKPEVATVRKDNTPNRITVNITEDPATSMAFNWFTSEETTNPIVLISESEDLSESTQFSAEVYEVESEYGERDENGYYIYTSAEKDDSGNFIVDSDGKPEEPLGYFTDQQIDRNNTAWTSYGSGLGHLGLQTVTEYTNKAEATGLEPDTKYYFTLGSESDGFSDTGSFTTASEESRPTQFIHYSDTQSAYWNEHVNNEAAYGANTLALALETAPDSQFALFTGDFVENAQVEDEWVDVLDQSRDSHLVLPHAFVAGNHDESNLPYMSGLRSADKTAFNDHTNGHITNDAIHGGSYYSFDHSGAHFVVLNTNDNGKSEDNPERGAIGTAQMEWARADIQEAQDNGSNWIILAFHKPIYSGSYHALQDSDVQVTREELVKLANDLNVDIVLQGHDHNLTRTKSLIYTDDNFAYAEVEETEKVEIDGVEHHLNPQGVTYVIPNTAGTKTYDALYQKGAEHVAEVLPRLDWLTDEDVDLWNNLFAIAEQPEDFDGFEYQHDNFRQSTEQSFAVYTFDDSTFTIKFYSVSGDLEKGEDRTVTLRDAYGIVKE